MIAQKQLIKRMSEVNQLAIPVEKMDILVENALIIKKMIEDIIIGKIMEEVLTMTEIKLDIKMKEIINYQE